MFKFCLILIVCLLHKYSESQTPEKPCRTPTNEESKCIPLLKCPSMISFVNNLPKPIPKSVTAALQGFVCPSSEGGINSLICCPSGSVNINIRRNLYNTPSPSLSPARLNVTNHKNLKYLPKNCGIGGFVNRIIGGDDAEIREFPWMALLIYNQNNKLIPNCGGTVVNKKYILTAAHCLVENTIPLAGVRVGEYNLLTDRDCVATTHKKICNPPVQHLLVERIMVHPKYDKISKINDIALLRVSKMNMRAVNVKPICLPIQQHITTDYEGGTVSGWGHTDENGNNDVSVLQKLYIPKRNFSVCTNVYKIFPGLKLSQNSYNRLCLGGVKGEDSCKGDSGGPFEVVQKVDNVYRSIQRGIVSIGHIQCGIAGFPAIYTNVDYYIEWILDNIYL